MRVDLLSNRAQKTKKELPNLNLFFFLKKREAETGKYDFAIIGLGNPGRDYKNSRHNVGFMILDQLASQLGTNFRHLESNALISNAQYKDKHLLLAKPQTYMNRSGQAVGSIIKSQKIPLQQMLVVYDDVDLPLGALRLRPEGGSAGHKGMASIIDRLGTSEFPRLRFGIGRPPGRKSAANYVLNNFSSQELEFLQIAFRKAVDAILSFTTEGIIPTMNTYNSFTS